MPRGGILQLKSQSAKISDNSHFRGGGILQLKSQSAKISDNSHLGGVFRSSLGILYGFSLCVTSSIFKYYSLFH